MGGNLMSHYTCFIQDCVVRDLRSSDILDCFFDTSLLKPTCLHLFTERILPWKILDNANACLHKMTVVREMCSIRDISEEQAGQRSDLI
ncbi:hypothetical protein TNIN_352621 [Trichonephila inaurata madagascariensis]|uniref:Uncharacterized protein n=1 Tax=Trichonephila inaurata madagascariensis TaxID=2747483 RepID=A0A8X6WYY4_9ARAC|nr:hypothetical protein TNIN_352621 [Trichonephila inaurata madagascariensis]